MLINILRMMGLSSAIRIVLAISSFTIRQRQTEPRPHIRRQCKRNHARPCETNSLTTEPRTRLSSGQKRASSS